jgi:hypothetical protein
MKENPAVGDVFGKLTITEEAEQRRFPSGQYHRQFKCQCECGNSALVLRMYLLNGHTVSCGCARVREYEGKTLGRYLVGTRTGKRDIGGAAEYMATCTECGTPREDSISTLRKAGARTCTCAQLRPGNGEHPNVRRYRQTATGRAAQLQSNAKRRAQEKGIPFDLDRLDLIERITAGRCEVTGLPFDLAAGAGLNPWAPSIDRIDSTKGYTPDNVQVVVSAYNIAKGPWSDDVLPTLARAIVDTVQVYDNLCNFPP